MSDNNEVQQPQPTQPAPAPGQQPPFAQATPTPQPAPVYQVAEPVWQGIGSPQKDKWVAALLAFTLGTLGIHKFYLGYKTEGLVQLLVSVIGGTCTLGIGWAVMQVIAIIEAVRYVTLTQQDFEQRYVINRKGWF